jgi:hypothetical protein
MNIMIEIIFGSNHFYDTNGIIEVFGKEQIELLKIAFRDEFTPLITTEIRDKNGVLLGNAYRSTSFVHVHDDCKFNIETEKGRPYKMELRKKENDELLFQLIVHRLNKVEINGIWYVKGLSYPIIATKDGVDLNTNIFTHNYFYTKGTPIKIDTKRIRIS